MTTNKVSQWNKIVLNVDQGKNLYSKIFKTHSQWLYRELSLRLVLKLVGNTNRSRKCNLSMEPITETGLAHQHQNLTCLL